MQKLKIKQMIESSDALRNLVATKLPIKVSYQISRLATEVDQELRVYDEKRREIILSVGKKDETTGDTSIDPADTKAIEKFQKDLEALWDIEVDIKFASKINIADLGSVEIEPKNLPEWLFSVEE